jgi:hypothetical protein
MTWPMNTRIKKNPLESQATTSTTGATLRWDVPKTGILAALMLVITGTLTGTPSTPVATGMAALISRVRLVANSGINLIDVSGIGYHYLLRDMLEHNVDPVPQASARNAGESGVLDLSMFFPIALNSRDPIGLIMLQNEDTQLTLEVEVAALTAVANDFSASSITIQPVLDVFTVPVDPKDHPPFDFAHTITEESQVVAAAGEARWAWPRGNIYAQVIHGLGVGSSGADGFTFYSLLVNQTDYIYRNVSAAFLTREFSRFRGRTRLGGVIPVDFLSQSGLGNYGAARDLLDSRQLTDINSVITASSAGTLRTVKRQLVPLPKAS